MTYAGATESATAHPVAGRRELVSVLLPCSGRPYAVQTRAIPSLLNQTYRDWELIVVSEGEDNASMREAIATFDDQRIRYDEIPRPDYRTSVRARALNRAQELARGDVLCLLDEDTEYLPSHIQESLDALHANSADLVYGRVRMHDPNTGQETEEYFPWEDAHNQTRFLDENIINPWSVCYTARWRTLEFPADADACPDYAKWTQMRQAGAEFVSLSAVQIVSCGDDITGRVRVSMPSLPPTESLHKLVDKVASTRQLSNHGPICAELEQALSNYLGVPHVVTAASGDTALGMAMLLAAERRGDRDEVVLPSYTFPSTVNAVLRAGLVPVFCDIEGDTLCASAATVAPHVSERTLAIFPVHVHGIPCEMNSLEALAHDFGALLIADAAAAMGAQVGTRKVGTFGDIEVFSLSSTKALTSGEGGFLSLHDDDSEARLREIARYGLGDNFVCSGLGVNGRLGELPAGIALAGLDRLDEWLAARRQTASLYEERLGGLEHLRIVPHRIDDRVGSAKDVVLVVDCSQLRDDLADGLSRYRIETRPYFRPLHMMGPFKQFAHTTLEVTEQVAGKMLCLPITNEIPESTTEFICGALEHELRNLTSSAT
jgi:dTDP-4-amino-4,6-dideoxygalactose transaminase